MKTTLPMELHEGVLSTTTEVWSILTASRNGELSRVQELVQRCPALATCQYDYTSTLHMAVREGHIDIVHYLIQRRALDPEYKSHPFMDSVQTIAGERGHAEIEQLLKRSLQEPRLTRSWGDTCRIIHKKDETQTRFEECVDKGLHAEVEAMLKERPGLALDETAFWGEGILAMPAHNGNHHMLELLMKHGAHVPDLSKWGARYYFKHYETAAFLLKAGMNPNHMNWRGFTVLHDMARTGDTKKARLLLEHGADINPIDDEYRSTPLGYAARWRNRELVALLLERGADPDKSGAPWARPLAWARAKGHAGIASDLKSAGANE